MEQDRPSTTAEMVCAWRALETLLPPERRIVSDPYARGFLGVSRRTVIDLAEKLPGPVLTGIARRLDRTLQGVVTFVMARHRAIDELLLERGGYEQVVLLGAGYDTRPVRLRSALANARVFEVDHPATAARKTLLADAAYMGAERVETIPVRVDFNAESLEERLLESGFTPGRPTFWVWEGVSMYLEESAVRATLQLVHDLSAPGSVFTCDLWCPVEGKGRLARVRRVTRRRLPAWVFELIYNEPLTWGPDRDTLDGFFAEHGLRLIERVPARELIQRYQPRRTLFELDFGMLFAVAEVARA